MGSSSILNDPPAKNDSRNWLDLPREVMVLILQRMCCYDVLTNVKQVCKSWHSLCKDPFTWQVIEIRGDVLLEKITKKKKGFSEEETVKFANMITRVIELSCGQMLDLSIFGLGSGLLLEHISQRSSRLRRVRQHYYDDLYIPTQELIQTLRNVPLLEELQLSNITKFSPEHIEIIGRCCPHLKSLALNNLRAYDIPCHPICSQLAFAIAKYMPRLCRLQLYGNSMTNEGLSAILHSCHHLEYLDIRQCYNIFVVLEPNLMTQLCKQIKHVRFSKDKTGVQEFDETIYIYEAV